MRRLRTSLTPEALIEKIALETLPAGSELVWACTGPGPPRRGLLYRTKKPVSIIGSRVQSARSAVQARGAVQ